MRVQGSEASLGALGTQHPRRGLRRNLHPQLGVSRDSAPIATLQIDGLLPRPEGLFRGQFPDFGTNNFSETMNGHPNE